MGCRMSGYSTPDNGTKRRSPREGFVPLSRCAAHFGIVRFINIAAAQNAAQSGTREAHCGTEGTSGTAAHTPKVCAALCAVSSPSKEGLLSLAGSVVVSLKRRVALPRGISGRCPQKKGCSPPRDQWSGKGRPDRVGPIDLVHRNKGRSCRCILANFPRAPAARLANCLRRSLLDATCPRHVSESVVIRSSCRE
jgi:hypothetical protein